MTLEQRQRIASMQHYRRLRGAPLGDVHVDENGTPIVFCSDRARHRRLASRDRWETEIPF